MEPKVKTLLSKHRRDKDLRSEKNYIEPGWDWSDADLKNFHLEGLTLSDYNTERRLSKKNKPAERNCMVPT